MKTLNDYKPSQATLNLVHPVYGETGVNLFVVGQQSKQYINKQLEILRENQTGKSITDRPLEDLVRDGRRMVASCIVGWDNDEFFGGPYTPELALDIIADPENQWLVEVIQEFTQDQQRFFSKAKSK